MRVNVSYSASCADHGPMIADPERDQWICLGHDLAVTKSEIVELIVRSHGEVVNAFGEIRHYDTVIHDQDVTSLSASDGLSTACEATLLDLALPAY
ncbi:MAG TPA: hypothetical protein VGR71_16620 [Nitrospira sp.]|nr:hypothetical protein [Nitrospira sp.]